MTDFKTILYYKLNITLASPLSVGSGENEYTDHDVIVDANGRPFIPATAIAGVMRSAVPEEANKIFGYIEEKTEISESSKVRFYDARLISDPENKCVITNRDSVKLKDKIGVKGAKFDMQAVETGAQFTAYIELLDARYSDTIEKCIAEMNDGVIRLGTKTTRGYGEVRVDAYKKTVSNIDEYLDFDMYKAECWKTANKLNILELNCDYRKIKLTLKTKGGIAIREYSTEVNMPDYKTLTLHGTKTPVIPGTSWAGAIRSRFEEFVGEYNLEDKDKTVSNDLFGQVLTDNGNETGAKVSKILFSESQLSNGTWKNVTRNSIDRFSGATKDGALYEEATYYFGTTELEMIIKKELSEKEKYVLASVIADLHNGFLAVGGLTSVGRGLFEITKVNGNTDCIKRIDAESKDFDINAFVKEVF